MAADGACGVAAGFWAFTEAKRSAKLLEFKRLERSGCAC